MKGRYILALDQGTTSSRALLFDEAGTIVSLAQEEFPQHFPQPGWVEHEAADIWESQLRVARAVLERGGAAARDIAAIGITNQRETTLIWERASGQPIHRAIVWQDRRTAPFCDELRAEGFDQTIAAQTGLVTDAYFSGTKVAWLLENVPGARERAERGELAFGTVDSWLLWQLTSGALHITDISNASRTMLYDIHHCRWSVEILARLDIPAALLPTVAPSSQVYGETKAEIFGAPIPHRWHRGRPTSGDLRANLHRSGYGEEYLRHWMFLAAADGRAADRFGTQPADDHRLAAGRCAAAICAGGQRLRGGRGGAVAAR